MALGISAASCVSSDSGTASALRSGSANASRRPDFEGAFRAAGEIVKFNAEALGELDEQRGSDSALIVFDQVEVAGGNAELGGERLL